MKSVSEIITEVRFERDNAWRLITVCKTKQGYRVHFTMPKLSESYLFATEDEALNAMGTKSLAGWRNFLTMARWIEVA